MASGITYPIQAKYKSDGEKKAIKGLHNITSAAKKFNMAVGGFVVAKVFQGINKVVSGSTEEFNKNNKALANFNKSIANNSKLAEGAVNRLQKSMDKFSANGLFGGDEMNNAAALASQMGLAEEQMTKVLDAATEMAASGIMPLDQAVKTLSQSYSGNVGQLKKICPELGNLTKEELENGKAVETLKAKYNGFRDTMASTFEGQDSKFQDAFGHLQEAVGGIFSGLKFGLEGKLMGPLHKAAEFLEENKETILKFFYNLPSVIKIVVETVWKMVKQTFTGPGFINLIEFMGNSIAVMVKSVFPLAFEGIKTLFGVISDIFDFTIGNFWRSMQDFLGNIGNKLIEVVNSSVSKIMQAPGIKQLYELISQKKAKDFEAITFRFDTNHAAGNTTWEDTKNSIGQRFDQLLTDYKAGVKSGIQAQKENLEEFIDFYSDIMEGASDELKEAINKELPEELKTAMAAAENGTGASTPATVENNDSGNTIEDTTEKISTLTQTLSKFGEVGEMINSIMKLSTSNFIGFILEIVGNLINALSSAAPAFGAFMNAISVIIDKIATEIAPIINTIFMPLVDILFSIGSMIGSLFIPILSFIGNLLLPVFQLLAQIMAVLTPFINVIGTLLNLFLTFNPIIDIFTTCIKALADVFAFIYNNIFQPVTNFLLKIVSTIGNFFIGMYNKVIDVLRSINIFGWQPFSGLNRANEIDYNAIKLDKITFDENGKQEKFDSGNGFNAKDYEIANSNVSIDSGTVASSRIVVGSGTADSGTATSSGAAASYTAPRDIIMNIDVGNVVGQDGMREFALMIRQEIKEAEALGR